MPLYEYKCKKCGHIFEKIQKFSDKPISKCPECGGKVEQLISPPAVQFKGTGWYVTDYARKGSSGSRSSEGDGGTKETKDKKESKKDEKPKSDSSQKKTKSE